jgi:hypothetical protein
MWPYLHAFLGKDAKISKFRQLQVGNVPMQHRVLETSKSFVNKPQFHAELNRQLDMAISPWVPCQICKNLENSAWHLVRTKSQTGIDNEMGIDVELGIDNELRIGVELMIED